MLSHRPGMTRPSLPIDAVLPIDTMAMQGGDDARLAEQANVHGPAHAHPRHMRRPAPLRCMGPHPGLLRPGLLHLGLSPDVDTRRTLGEFLSLTRARRSGRPGRRRVG